MALSFAACHNSMENKEAVQRGIMDRLSSAGLSTQNMDVDVNNVQFHSGKAEADVEVRPKGASHGQGMQMHYGLENQSGRWVVTSRADMAGHGGAVIPGSGESPRKRRHAGNAAGSRRSAHAFAAGSAAGRQETMKSVAILGGGPAGAFAAEQLAAAGLKVRLFDEKLAWEKPCGGGLTFKAYNQYPFLIENSTPKRFVTESVLAAPNAGEASLRLDDPLLIYSRIELNRMLLDRAEKAGAQLEKVRVLEMERSGAGWLLRTKTGAAEADFCIVATGRAQSAARCGDAVDAARYDVRARLLRAGRADAHRHPVSAASRGLHLDLPALRPHVGGHLRQGRIRPARCACAWSAT